MNADDQSARVEARRGFFPVVRGGEVSLSQAGALVCISGGDLDLTQGGTRMALARGDLSVTEGGGFLLAGGGNLTVREGGAFLLASGGDASISSGGAGIVAGRSVRVEQSFVGVALGFRTEVADDSKVVIGPRQAAIIGAVAGLVCAGAVRLLAGRAVLTGA